MNHVTAAQYQAAMRGAIPQVAPVFWSFRIMVGCGSPLLLVMLIALVQTLRGKIDQHRWVLKMALWSLPLPWIAIGRMVYDRVWSSAVGDTGHLTDILRALRLNHRTTGFLTDHDRRALHPVLNRRSLPDAEICPSGAERDAE